MNREEFIQKKQLDKERFYQKMQPYFDQGMVREIYSSLDFSILSFGERVYVACPYFSEDEPPFGIYMTSDVMKKLVKKNRLIYPLTSQVLNKLSSNLLFNFDLKRLEFWKQWIRDNKDVNKIDYNLEAEIAQMSKGESN